MKLRRCARSFACLFVVFTGAAAIAQDQQVAIPSMKDNTLYEDDMGLLSNGAGQHMFVGTTNFSPLLRRALIAFDIAGNIPAGSTIQSVALTLNMSQTSGIAIDIDLRIANRDWGEGTSMASGGEGGGDAATPGDATWVHTFFDTVWQLTCWPKERLSEKSVKYSGTRARTRRQSTQRLNSRL